MDHPAPELRRVIESNIEVKRLSGELATAHAERHAAVAAAHDAGLSLQVIADALTVSRGRVAQLVNIERKREERRAAKRRAREQRRAERAEELVV